VDYENEIYVWLLLNFEYTGLNWNLHNIGLTVTETIDWIKYIVVYLNL